MLPTLPALPVSITAASPARTITYADTEPRTMRSQEAAAVAAVVEDSSGRLDVGAAVAVGTVVVEAGRAVVVDAPAPLPDVVDAGPLAHAANPSTETPTATLPRSARNTRLVISGTVMGTIVSQ